jgi:hypothetical protein
MTIVTSRAERQVGTLLASTPDGGRKPKFDEIVEERQVSWSAGGMDESGRGVVLYKAGSFLRRNAAGCGNAAEESEAGRAGAFRRLAFLIRPGSFGCLQSRTVVARS